MADASSGIDLRHLNTEIIGKSSFGAEQVSDDWEGAFDHILEKDRGRFHPLKNSGDLKGLRDRRRDMDKLLLFVEFVDVITQRHCLGIPYKIGRQAAGLF